MSPLAHRWNVAGEHLSHVEEEAVLFAPGPVSLIANRPRLSDDIATLSPSRIGSQYHDEQFSPVALAPQHAPQPLEESLFAAEFTGNGRRARNPLGHWTYRPSGSPEGVGGWQEDQFRLSGADSHHEFYPGIEPTEGDTFLFEGFDQRRNVAYDRPTSFGEQVSRDEEGALYQDLGARGGY